MRVLIFILDGMACILLNVVTNKEAELTSITSTFQIICITSMRIYNKQLVCFINSVAFIKCPWSFQIFSYSLNRSFTAINTKFVAQIVEDLSNEFFFLLIIQSFQLWYII